MEHIEKRQFILPLLTLSAFFLLVPSARAYVPELVAPQSVGENISIADPTLKQYFYGTLDDFPHTYELVVKEPTELSVEVHVPDTVGAQDVVNGIIVKREGRQGRVVEVARLLAKDAQWESWYEPWGADSYRKGSTYHATVEPGTYRVEVSTPDNTAPYVLVIGTRDDREGVSYFEMVKRIIAVKQFYGRAPIAAILSPYLYIPILVILFVSIVAYVRRVRKAHS